MRFSIYFNFEVEVEKFVYTRYCVWEIFKKLGLVKEALGELGDLTRACKYHYVASGSNLLNLREIFAACCVN